MPIVQTTTTRTRFTTTRTTTVPIWLVKLITVVICCIVLLLTYLHHYSLTHYYFKTFMFVMLTVGALLGWSIGSVLQQIITMRNVEITVNVLLTALAVVSAVLCVNYLFNTNESSSGNNFKMMVGMTACFVAQSIVCLLMLSWACYGNIVVFTSA